MICFLTSKTDLPEMEDVLNPSNRFIDELRLRFPKPCRALYISSDPDDPEATDFYSGKLKESLREAGFRFQLFRTLDGRNERQAAKLVKNSNLLVLTGGHVPTQNRFFRKIGLRELLKDFPGVIIGISAGSMNSADVVYAQPELDGEAVDPDYQRFLPGLGLTKTMLLPHYQEVKDAILDDQRLFEDITCSDSEGRTFYAIPDGSYLFIESGREELRGEAYRISEGIITQITGEDEIYPLSELRSRIQKTEAFLKQKYDSGKYLSAHPDAKAYRLEHTYRVANIGRRIALREGFDETEMVIACLLHDISYCEEFGESGWKEHGRLSARIARPFLEGLGLPEDRINDICYGIAIHVDDEADFPGEKTAFALSVGDADNIDRFDAFRIHEMLSRDGFLEKSLEEKLEYARKRYTRLCELMEMPMATEAAEEMWRERVSFSAAFYEKLIEQLRSSHNILTAL